MAASISHDAHQLGTGAPPREGPRELGSLERLVAVSDETLAELRAALARAGFDAASVFAMEKVAGHLFDALRLPVVWWHLRRQTAPAALLSRLFVYDDRVPRQELAALLGDKLLADLEQAGLVATMKDGEAEASGGQLISPFRLTPFEACWFISDPLEAGPEAVMGPGVTTWQLDQLLPATPGLRLLDVGCGAGTLALAAARRGAGAAVGVDISPRAIALANLNARLNALAATFLVGDLTAPVRGQTFDVVVSQPPYVMRPPTREGTTFLHGGPVGDELALRLLAEVPALLESADDGAEAGRALVMFDVALRAGPSLAQRVRAAMGDQPVDVLVLGAKGASSDVQSLAYASLDAPGLGPAYAQAVLAYREHLAELGVEEFRRQLVVLSRSCTPSNRRPYDIVLPVASLAQCSRHEVDGLRRSLVLAHCSPDDLRQQKLDVYPEAKLLRAWSFPRTPSLTSSEEAAPPSAISLRFPKGALAQDRELAENSAFLLELLDASPTVAQAVQAYAEACGVPAPEVEGEVLAFVRESLARRVLVPRPSSPPPPTPPQTPPPSIG